MRKRLALNLNKKRRKKNSHYKLDVTDFCVSNLSNKPGAKRFALCPCWGTKGHEHATSSAHTVPKNFNLKYIDQHFMEKKKAGQKRNNKRKSPA